MFKIIPTIVILLFRVKTSNAQSFPPIPEGTKITLTDIITLTQNIGGFLFTLGTILAAITIILSGIMYFFSGGDTQGVKKARDVLKAGIIGALILSSVGIIIGTIQGFAINPLDFFKWKTI